MKKLTALITVIAILLCCDTFAAAWEHTAQIAIAGDLITATGATSSTYVGINVKNSDSEEIVFVGQETVANGNYSFRLNVREHGKYTVTLNDGITTIKEEVSYLPDMSAEFSAKDTLTLYEGEVCGLDAVYKTDSERKEIYWATSDESIVSLFGNAYTTRTIIAEKAGMAIVSISSPAGYVLDKIYITVKPKAEENTRSALFELTGESFPVNKNLLGIHMHTNPIVGDGLKLLKENITFNCLRTGYCPEDGQSYSEYSADFAARLKQHNMTFIINLSRFAKDSAEELMEQVKEIYAIVSPLQDKVYIEFGNEMYTADISQEDYIDKVKALYPMVKNYSEDIYASVPLLGQYFDDMGAKWDDKLAEISDYFDAVSPHNYSGTSSYNLLTQNTYMENLFASNFYHREANKWVADKFPGKQIWVTEYGYLNSYLFNTASTVVERCRVQTAKNPGPAIGTAEKFLDMTVDKNIVFANYHAPNDTQCFGMVQEYNGQTDKLPGFYIYKELASLINSSDTVYKTNAIYTDEFISKIDSTFAYTDKSVDYVGAYCYGGDDGKYIVFVNRSEDECSTALKGYKLAQVWKYAPDYILGDDYLQRTQDWYAPPEDVEIPEILSEAPQSAVTLDAYSMTVCRVVEEDPETVCAFDIKDGEMKVSPNRTFTLNFNCAITQSNANISLQLNGKPVNVKIEKLSDSSYSVTPEKALCYDGKYTLSALGGSVSFTVAESSENDCEVTLYKKIENEVIPITSAVCGQTYLKITKSPAEGAVVFLAGYNENGVLQSVTRLSLTDENSFEIAEKYYYKVLFLENLQTIKPFCASYNIKQ